MEQQGKHGAKVELCAEVVSAPIAEKHLDKPAPCLYCASYSMQRPPAQLST